MKILKKISLATILLGFMTSGCIRDNRKWIPYEHISGVPIGVSYNYEDTRDGVSGGLYGKFVATLKDSSGKYIPLQTSIGYEGSKEDMITRNVVDMINEKKHCGEKIEVVGYPDNDIFKITQTIINNKIYDLRPKYMQNINTWCPE